MAMALREVTKTIRELAATAGAEWMPYGHDEHHVEVAAGYGHYEAEYAAVRQRVGIMWQPQRGAIVVAGEDAASFLQSVLSNDIDQTPTNGWRRHTLMNNKGRIEADLLVLKMEDQLLMLTDRMDVAATMASLDRRLFTEDCQLTDQSDALEQVSLFGPAAVQLMDTLLQEGESIAGLEAGQVRTVQVDGQSITVYRRDELGVIGLHLLVPTEVAAAVYLQLIVEAGYDPREVGQQELDATFGEQRRQGLRGRPIGWEAYNTARIEAGTLLYHIDFGPDSIPNETGILDEICSLTKGCYLGQEIVARMKNLGHPKRLSVRLEFDAKDAGQVPVAGSQVMTLPEEESDAEGAKLGTVIGGITSSSASPIKGQVPVAFAVVKWGHHRKGTQLRISVEGDLVDVHVADRLNSIG